MINCNTLPTQGVSEKVKDVCPLYAVSFLSLHNFSLYYQAIITNNPIDVDFFTMSIVNTLFLRKKASKHVEIVEINAYYHPRITEASKQNLK